MADQNLYRDTVPSDGSLALAHQKILRVKQNGVFVNITGDINNLAGNPTAVTVPREVYGTKGRTASDIIGYNFAPTFAVEAVRDPETLLIVAAQSWLIDLLDAAYSEGAANRREFQWFDALDDRLPALQGTFSVAVADLNTGYADKGGYTFTLANYGVVDKITSPIAGTGEPVIESITPAGQEPGDQVVIRGYKLSGTTGVTIGGQAVTELIVVGDNTLVVVIPASLAGVVPVIATNTAGASTAVDYQVDDPS